jgi:deferrochelatase/peroxidase EfeB
MLSRRALLGAAAGAAGGLVVGGIAGPLLGPPPAEVARRDTRSSSCSPYAAPASTAPSRSYPFFGLHQAGVTTPVQEHLHFAAFDMVDGTDRRDLVRLLRDWSRAAHRMTQGLAVRASGALDGDPAGDPEVPPEDTGEALDLAASGLTVTVGFGPTLFEQGGVDRFGLSSERPLELAHLPPFAGDAIDLSSSHGDIGVQVCSDDPQVAFHAIRNLARIASGRAAMRWSQSGFQRTSPAPGTGRDPRNLLGFKDGTNNIRIEDEGALDEFVWLPSANSRSWLAGGTYLVVRKIRMLIEAWDQESLARQQVIIGRTKVRGEPLSGGDESTAPDFEASAGGSLAIDRAAHIRLAHASSVGGIRILRRGYSYVNGTDPLGCLDAGLMFIAYQRSPGQFIAIQQALTSDLLNEYVRPVGSALFAVPPGAAAGGFIGETLLG